MRRTSELPLRRSAPWASDSQRQSLRRVGRRRASRAGCRPSSPRARASSRRSRRVEVGSSPAVKFKQVSEPADLSLGEGASRTHHQGDCWMRPPDELDKRDARGQPASETERAADLEPVRAVLDSPAALTSARVRGRQETTKRAGRPHVSADSNESTQTSSRSRR